MRIQIAEPEAFTTLLIKQFGKSPASPITGISTDSRECQVGDLYIALKGERSDGHQFIQQAMENGAVACLADREVPVKNRTDLFVVESPLRTLGSLAKSYRKLFQIPVIGITGSNGKTSTKELLKHIFSTRENVHATTGNFNTSIGLPLTLFQISYDHSISIIEMGANQPGDIAYLCSIAVPTLGLITNITPAHLEGFGTIAEVAKTKGALFKSLTEGTAFVNNADDLIRELEVVGERISYGITPDCDFPADIHHEKNGSITVTIDTQEIATGSHNLSFIKNVIAASAVCIHLGIDWKTFETQVQSFQSPQGRCEVKQIDNITIIDDTYNANLTSTMAAIDYLKAFSGNGRRIFVFGDMFELGGESLSHHRKVGEHCSEMNLDAVFTIGDNTRETDNAIDSNIFHKHFASKGELVSELKEWIKEGDKLLVKGSRGMSMESILEDLEAN